MISIFYKGFPGSIHDITIARISGIVDFANQNGEAGIGDKAYQGEKCFFTPIKQYVKRKKIKLNEEEKRYNKSLEKYRNNVERVNNRIKIFKCTREKWRHSIDEHSKMISVKLWPDDAYAMVVDKNGKGYREEFYYGHSYLSQGTRTLFLPEGTERIEIYSFTNKRRTIKL